MTVFLDAEFNGFGGQLISLAMVSDDGRPGHELYVVRELPETPCPWVEQHVIPVLQHKPISDAAFQRRVIDYIRYHGGQTIIADWPEDFVHLLRLLGTMPGWAYRLNIDMRLVNTGGDDLPSKIPHNALSDAHALLEWYHASNA